jgi:hypothetical protein
MINHGRYLTVFLVIYGFILSHKIISEPVGFGGNPRFRGVASSDPVGLFNCQKLGASLATTQDLKLTPRHVQKLSLKIEADSENLTALEEVVLTKRIQEVFQQMAEDHKRFKELDKIETKDLSRKQAKEISELEANQVEFPPFEQVEKLQAELGNGNLADILRQSDMSMEDFEKLMEYLPLENDPYWYRGLNLLKSNSLVLAPTFLLPLAAIAFDGGLTLALMSGLKLSAGIKGMEISLDWILDNSAKLVDRKTQAFIIALSGNLVEAGSSFYPAAVKNVPVEDAGAIPLGSNPMNFALMGAALVGSVKKIAKDKGILKRGKMMTPMVFLKTLRSLDYKAIKGESMWALLMVTNALTFQYFVRPAMMKGNYLPFIGWMATSFPMMGWYFAKDIISNRKAFTNAVHGFDEESLKKLSQTLKHNDSDFKQTKAEFKTLTEGLIQAKDDGELGKAKVKEALKDLQGQMRKSKSVQKEVARVVHQLNDKEVSMLLEMGGVSLERAATMTKEQKLKAITMVVTGMAAVGALSILLDSGVEDMAESFPGMGKTSAGFFVMSFFSSLPELMGTMKFFQGAGASGQAGTDNFKSGAQNISDSNALNLGIAKMAMGIAYMRSLFSNEQITEEVEIYNEDE